MSTDDIMQEAREATEGRFVLRLRAWGSDKRTVWMAEELEKTRRERDEARELLRQVRHMEQPSLDPEPCPACDLHHPNGWACPKWLATVRAERDEARAWLAVLREAAQKTKMGRDSKAAAREHDARVRREALLEGAAALIEKLPLPYDDNLKWAERNHRNCWNQCCHHAARKLRALAEGEE